MSDDDLRALRIKLAAGDNLAPDEGRRLRQIIEDEPERGAEIADDLEIDGALRAMGRTENDATEFARTVRRRIAVESNGRRFAADVRGTLERSGRARALKSAALRVTSAAAAVVALAVGFSYWTSRAPGDVSTRSLGTVVAAEGAVEMLARGEIRGVRVGDLVGHGDRVTVPVGGVCGVELTGDRAALRLEGGTDLALHRSAEGVEVDVRAGALDAHVAKQARGRIVSFVTPHANAAVLGTSLKLRVRAGATRLDVDEGRVLFTRLADEEHVVVGDGEFAVAGPHIDLAARRPRTGPVPSFPGAQGYGALAVGGRGGRVIPVTSLADDGPGSLREALTSTGRRIVVFRVGGTIVLDGRIELGAVHSFLTVAGQTAPGDGVQVKGADLFLGDGIHDVVIRNLRLRPGVRSPADWQSCCLSVAGSSGERRVHDVIIDHCSLYWGSDETAACWDHVRDVTWQWCVVEGLAHRFPGVRLEESKTFLIGTDRGEGGNIGRIAIHHCYLANSDQFNPLFAGDGPFQFVNNLVYNWGHFGTGIDNRGEGTKVNLIGNVYRRGPSSHTTRYAIGIDGAAMQPDGLVYVRDNIGPYRPDATHDDWAIVGWGFDRARYWTRPAPPSKRRAEAWPDAAVSIDAVASRDVADAVLGRAGATAPRRDALDRRAVRDFHEGAGVLREGRDQRDDWWPVLMTGAPPTDADGDGMPDEWERARALDPADAADGAADRDGDGYTNLEEYLNGLMSVPDRR